MKKIGLYVNYNKKDSLEMAKRCIAFFQSRSIEVMMLSSHQKKIGNNSVKGLSKAAFYCEPDCIVTLGGDGTLLNVARHASQSGIPICGVNLGHVGFLTEGEAKDLESILTDLSDGNFTVESRMMLFFRAVFEDGRLEEHIALNDVTVKSIGLRMMEITAKVDKTEIDTFRADGLIVASPTGSTAYSLAAGGPVVSPETNVMVISPICPHRLHNRSYVINSDSVIDLTFRPDHQNIIVSIDGQINIPMTDIGSVEVKCAERTTQLIRMSHMSFYDRLRSKLSYEIKGRGVE